MTGAEPSRSLRLVAVVLFCGLPLLLLALAIGDLVETVTAREIAAKQDATANEIVRQITKHQAHRPPSQDASALFLASASASLARAELQEHAARFVEAAGG